MENKVKPTVEMEKYFSGDFGLNPKPFGIGRNWDYLKINFFIMYKRLLEYKSNFYSSFPLEMFYFFTMFIFFNVIFGSFENDFLWTIEDFILHMVFSGLSFALVGIFVWKDTLHYFITEGELNLFLIRPLNRGFMFYTSYLAPPSIVFIIVDTLAIILSIFYFEIQIHNYFISFLAFILILIFLLVTYCFMFSLDFVFLGISKHVSNLLFRVHNIFEMYPAPFFMNLTYKVTLMFFSIFFLGSLFIPLLRGYEVWKIGLQFTILISLTLLFALLTILNWKYGLKKYEAFG